MKCNVCIYVFAQVPPPIVTWNIAPSMGHTYKCREAELVPIPRYCLRMVEKVGTCHAGEVSISNFNIQHPRITGIWVTEFHLYEKL
jgi:hypothetical protein